MHLNKHEKPQSVYTPGYENNKADQLLCRLRRRLRDKHDSKNCKPRINVKTAARRAGVFTSVSPRQNQAAIASFSSAGAEVRIR